MKKSPSVLSILGAAILATACNTSRPSTGHDAGTIIIPDSGGVDSGGTGTDTGPRDSGGGGGSCTLTVAAGNFGSLTAGCFPRCAAATLDAINACTTGACQQSALDADTTPGTAWSANGMAQTMQLDCGGCFANQQLHCMSTSGCADEVDAYITCAGGGGACDAEIMTLNTCAMTNATALNTCANNATMGIVACFGG